MMTTTTVPAYSVKLAVKQVFCSGDFDFFTTVFFWRLLQFSMVVYFLMWAAETVLNVFLCVTGQFDYVRFFIFCAFFSCFFSHLVVSTDDRLKWLLIEITYDIFLWGRLILLACLEWYYYMLLQFFSSRINMRSFNPVHSLIAKAQTCLPACEVGPFWCMGIILAGCPSWNDGLLHEIIEGKMRGEPAKRGEEFNCEMTWQMVMAMLHSNGQLRVDRDGDTEEDCWTSLPASTSDQCGWQQDVNQVDWVKFSVLTTEQRLLFSSRI